MNDWGLADTPGLYHGKRRLRRVLAVGVHGQGGVAAVFERQGQAVEKRLVLALAVVMEDYPDALKAWYAGVLEMPEHVPGAVFGAVVYQDQAQAKL